MTSHLVRKVIAVKVIFAEMVLHRGQVRLGNRAGLDSSTGSTVVGLTMDFASPNLFEKGKKLTKQHLSWIITAAISRLIRSSSEMYGCTGKSAKILKRKFILAMAFTAVVVASQNRHTSPKISSPVQQCLVTAVNVVTGQSQPRR